MKDPIDTQFEAGSSTVTRDSLKNLLLSIICNNPKMAEEFRTKQLWEETVPQEVLNHTCTMYVENKNEHKKLTICVDSSHWAAELNARSFELLTSVNIRLLKQEPSRKLYDALYFKVSHSAAKRKEYHQKAQEIQSYLEPVEPVKLSKKEENEVAQIVSAISDENLQKAVNKAMISNLEWRKGIKAVKES